MMFNELSLKGAFIIEHENVVDERGFFARTWDKKIFEKKGLNSNIVQCNISFNKKRGTLRGMHYQEKPFEEAKLVRCTKGKVFEVMIDLRQSSGTFRKWTSVVLSEDDSRMLYTPEGFALGFQALKDKTELFYQMSQYFMPEYSKGIRWNDPIIGIRWPLDPIVISKKDSEWELLVPDKK